MRYFVQLAYDGTQYCGWQRQPNSPSVQETLETTFATILRQPIEIVGCGRTDTGVHASHYFAHFDFEGAIPDSYIHRLNKMLPKDISLYQIFEVSEEEHARFSATERAYEYHMHFHKSPFLRDRSFLFPYPESPDFELMQVATSLLKEYEAFFPFCKTNTDVKTMICKLEEARWEQLNDQQWVFHIAANRFLRGMVRLIVGMSINVGMKKITLTEVETAMTNQTRLEKSWSVPAQGLFLTRIEYPFLKAKE